MPYQSRHFHRNMRRAIHKHRRDLHRPNDLMTSPGRSEEVFMNATNVILDKHYSSIVQDTVGTSYSIDLRLYDLITKSWRQRSRVATKKQYSSESVAELLQCQWNRLQLRRQTIQLNNFIHGKSGKSGNI